MKRNGLKNEGRHSSLHFADMLLFLSLIASMSFRLTGDIAHEIAGIIMSALTAFHVFAHRRWIVSFFFRRKNASDIFRFSVLIVIFLLMIGIVVSGIIMSKIIHVIVSIDGSLLVRQIHVMLAYWVFVFSSIHIGVHFRGMRKRLLGIPFTNVMVYRVAGIFIAAAGIWAFSKREIASKLLMQSAFGFVDPEECGIAYLYSLTAVAGLFVFVSYYAMKTAAAFRSIKKKMLF
jgi:hypothetical protein